MHLGQVPDSVVLELGGEVGGEVLAAKSYAKASQGTLEVK